MRVLISGAGIAGPTLAYFLARAGARVTIFEKAPSLLPYGQNIDVNGTALAVIKKMGLLDELKRYNTTEKGTRFVNAKGKRFAPFPVREGQQGSFTVETEILRGDLSLICYEASLRSPNVQYVFDTTITRILSNNDTSVKVETSHGDVQEFDVLVAADGQWSRVRKECFPPESVQVKDMGMYAIYFTIPRLPEDDDWWTVYQSVGKRIVTIRPDPYGTIRAMFTAMPIGEDHKKAWADVARSDRATKNEFLRREFADAGWQSDRLLREMEKSPDFYFHKIEQIHMKKWSTGRVVCLGDAAYAPTPLTGAGANLAILGGYLLAGELGKLSAGEHPSKAFEAYETIFRPWVEKTQEVPSIVPGIAHARTPFQRWLFNQSVSAMSRLVPLIAGRTGKVDDEDFKPLPQYPNFDVETV